MSANIWEPGTGPFLVDAENSNRSQVFTATEGQSVFTLTLFTYALNTGSIAVYRNGQRLVKDVDWTEATEDSFNVSIPLDAGDTIECVSFVTLAAEKYDTITQLASEVSASSALVQELAATTAANAEQVSLNTPLVLEAANNVETLSIEFAGDAATAAAAANTASIAAAAATAAAETASANAISAEASATEASAVGVILGGIAGGLGFTDSTVYDFGAVADTFNIFPTNYGSIT